MRFMLTFLLCLASACGCTLAVGKITVDPNTGPLVESESTIQPDQLLNQKVTYEARHREVKQIIDDLNGLTGVKLIAGSRSSDWPVRSRKMNIFAKDVRMADLMNSIARAMKFRWKRIEDSNPPIYRLVADGKAVTAADLQRQRAEKIKEEFWQKKRDQWIEIIMRDGDMSDSEVESKRTADPVFYRYARYGALRALRALFLEVPETKDRFSAGLSFRIAAKDLSRSTQELLYNSANEFAKFMQTGHGSVVGLTKVKPDDKYDIAYCRLDVDAFTPNRRWSLYTEGSTGYFHISKGTKEPQIVSLGDKDADWTRAMCERENSILDTQERTSMNPAFQSHVPALMVHLKKESELLYPSEPLNKHHDSPELQKMIKLKLGVPKSDENPGIVTCRHIADLQKAIAEATGMTVVSDSWSNIDGEQLPQGMEGTLAELLEKFASQFDYNWNDASGILEFRYRKWWKNRLNQIPDEWVAAWSANTRKNGILSLDDLGAISILTYDQAEESLKPDTVLGKSGLYTEILTILDADGNLRWLRLYATLSAQLRALLASERGVNGFMLTGGQWKQAQAMFDRIGSSRGDAVFQLKTIPVEGTVGCYFKEMDPDTGVVDREFRVLLPRHQPANQNNAH